MSLAQGLDKVPDSVGYMILNEDGAVLTSGGELEGQERIAGLLTSMVGTLARLRKADGNHMPFQRASVVYDNFLYALTVTNSRIFVVKKFLETRTAAEMNGINGHWFRGLHDMVVFFLLCTHCRWLLVDHHNFGLLLDKTMSVTFANEDDEEEKTDEPEKEKEDEGRTLIYGLIELQKKRDDELLDLMEMAEQLRLPHLFARCQDIVMARHGPANMPNNQNEAKPEPRPKASPLRSPALKQRGSIFLAGRRRSGKLKV